MFTKVAAAAADVLALSGLATSSAHASSSSSSGWEAKTRSKIVNSGVGGVVTFTVPDNGRIGAAGVVYDNGGVGRVIVSDLTGDGRAVRFHNGSHPHPPVKPKQPWVKPPDCGGWGTLAIPLQVGVSFKVNGKPWKAGGHRVRPGLYLVSAHALDGRLLVGARAWKKRMKPGGTSQALALPATAPQAVPRA